MDQIVHRRINLEHNYVQEVVLKFIGNTETLCSNTIEYHFTLIKLGKLNE